MEGAIDGSILGILEIRSVGSTVGYRVGITIVGSGVGNRVGE